MNDSRALELVRRQEVLAAERSPWESHWQEIAELFTPFRANFQGTRTFDGTPGLAAENLAAGLWGLLTNSANTWFQLRHEEEALNEDQAVTLWLDEAGRRLMGAFGSGGQRFYARVVDLFSDLVHFGTAVFYVDEVPGQRRLHFSCRHLAECFIAENEQEQVDTLFRRFALTARQVALRFPETLGGKLRERAEKRPDERVELLHAVLPAREYAGGGALRGQRWASVYVALEEGLVLSEGGYWDFPYQVPRWSQRGRAVYGDSPAMLVHGDEDARRAAVRQAFYACLLMMINVEAVPSAYLPVMAEMSSHLERVRREFLDPVIERTFNVLDRRKEMPTAPEILRGAVVIDYPAISKKETTA